MSNLRKLRRTQISKREPPVLIVRPHKMEGQSCQATSLFIMKNHLSGIAISTHMESKTPEVARNKAILGFLHDMKYRHCSHIFFLDDDSTPYAEDAILRLLNHRKPFVAGLTPIMRYREGLIYHKSLINAGIMQHEKTEIDCHWNAVIEKDGRLENIGIDEKPEGLFKAYRIGGTGILVRRDVLEKLKPPYQITTYNERYTDVKLSEDMYFSDKVREAGFDLWVDPAIECHHFHNLDILDMFKALVQAKKMGYEQAKKDFKVAV